MALASERLQHYISTWILMPLRRLKLKPSVLLITALFLTFIYILHGSLSGSEAPLSENSHAQIAKDVQTKLESMVQMPIDVSDFKGMGERTAAFASLTEALVTDSNLNRIPLLSLLKQQFPWLQHVEWRWYTPFSNIAGAETGLVICVGSKDFLLAAHLIRTLRDVLGSSLPIEIAYAGESDLLATERDALKALDSKLETINLLEYYDESIAGLQNGGFAMKPFALLASRFRKAILVDADVLFLQRPDTIFETHPMLKETGTLFWHDRAYPKVGDFSRRDWIKGLLNGKQPSAMLNQSLFWEYDLWQEMDSGVVCIDKARTSAFMGLLFASWMNTEKVRKEVVYEHVLGKPSTHTPFTSPFYLLLNRPFVIRAELKWFRPISRRQRNLLAGLRTLFFRLLLPPHLRRHDRQRQRHCRREKRQHVQCADPPF